MTCRSKEAVVAVVKANFPEALKRDKKVEKVGVKVYRGRHGKVSWYENVVVVEKNGRKIWITLKL